MEKKVHFKLHKVKKHWVTIAVTGLTLGLSFAGLNYASAEEQPTPVNEATVEAIIKEGAIDVEAPATSEATTKPTENTTCTASARLLPRAGVWDGRLARGHRHQMHGK